MDKVSINKDTKMLFSKKKRNSERFAKLRVSHWENQVFSCGKRRCDHLSFSKKKSTNGNVLARAKRSAENRIPGKS